MCVCGVLAVMQVDKIMEILSRERDPQAANKALSAVQAPAPHPSPPAPLGVVLRARAVCSVVTAVFMR